MLTLRFIRLVRTKNFPNISYPLALTTSPICTYTCAYQGVKNIRFLENFMKVLNEWSLIALIWSQGPEKYYCILKINSLENFRKFPGKKIYLRWSYSSKFVKCFKKLNNKNNDNEKQKKVLMASYPKIHFKLKLWIIIKNLDYLFV